MKKIRNDVVKWGIIGVGDVCEVKSAPAMNKIPHSQIEIVMRRNAEKVADYARRHKIAKWCTDAREVIQDSEVNAIYIATPPKFHLDYALMAAAAGKPAYVEKPMARNHAECQEMVRAFEQADLPLYIAYYRRRLPNFLYVKKLLEEKVIGDIRLVNIELVKTMQPDILAKIAREDDNWRVNPELAGGGYFYDLASHQLDLMDFFFGPIAEASGFAANQAGAYAANDIVVGSFRFENGIMGNGTWSFNAGQSGQKEIATILGSKGQIRFPIFGTPWVELELDTGEKDKTHFDMPKHIQQPLIESIIDDLMGKGACPSTGHSGARTNWVMESMTQG